MTTTQEERQDFHGYKGIRHAGSFKKDTGISGPELGRVWCPGDRIFVDIYEYFELSVSKVYLFQKEQSNCRN